MALRVKEAADILGVSTPTIRLWCNQGKLEYKINAAGQRIFNQKYLENYLNQKLGIETSGQKIYYARASAKNDVTTKTQVTKLTEQYGKPDKVFIDNASGLNENRPGLKQLLKYVKENPNTKIFITNNDRLTRFGYSYLEELINEYGGTITVLDCKETKEPHEILMEDFMSLIASFSGKFYRLRGWEQRKKFITKAKDEVMKNDSNQNTQAK